MNETIRAHGLAILRSSLLVVGMGVVLGGLAAPIWHSMVTLPTYTVGSDGAASTTEKGLTQVFSTDAVYCLVGLIVGLIIGFLSWVLMRRRGAWGVLAAGVSSCLSALACWWVGGLSARTPSPSALLRPRRVRSFRLILPSTPGCRCWSGCLQQWSRCLLHPW